MAGSDHGLRMIKSVWLLNLCLLVPHVGVTLEHRRENLGNNSLVSLDDIGEGADALFCKTDKMPCCGETDGNWYLPDGTLVPSDTITSNSRNLYVTRDANHSVGLNSIQASGVNKSHGIYSCKILDRQNDIKYLYVGIYPPTEGE